MSKHYGSIAFTDEKEYFRGNLRYDSTGNMTGDGRVEIIAVDYAHQRRLKIQGADPPDERAVSTAAAKQGARGAFDVGVSNC